MMWFSRHKQKNVALPKKCFISHSYHDTDIRDQLIRQLPKGVEPFVFPPITVSPEAFISNKLIEAILGCDGLIYLKGGHSAESFWVAFERDYAIRAGKKVFVYDPVTQTIEADISLPMRLPVFSNYARADLDKVKHVVRFMREDRFFDVWMDIDNLSAGVDISFAIAKNLEENLEAGGYMAVFCSRDSLNSHWLKVESEMAVLRFPRQVLLVYLQPIESGLLPAFLQARYLDKSLQPVQLYGDTERSFTQRMDDLVVRLYWLIYRNTRQQGLD